MWRTSLYAILAITGGRCPAPQSTVNARMRDVLRGSPWSAAMVSVIISAVILAALALIGGQGHQVARSLGEGPWWAYLGGVLGVVFLVTSLAAVVHMGATVTDIAVTLGGTVSAAVADRVRAARAAGHGSRRAADHGDRPDDRRARTPPVRSGVARRKLIVDDRAVTTAGTHRTPGPHKGFGGVRRNLLPTVTSPPPVIIRT